MSNKTFYTLKCILIHYAKIHIFDVLINIVQKHKFCLQKKNDEN